MMWSRINFFASDDSFDRVIKLWFCMIENPLFQTLQPRGSIARY